MKRLHLFEIHDLSGCPAALRDAMTDYLQHVIQLGNPYRPITKLLKDALEQVGTDQVIDLCSGGAGPWIGLQRALAEEGCRINVCLTDKFPNIAAFQRAQAASEGSIRFCSEPVDATHSLIGMKGFRTLFSSFHHFPPEQARAILADAVRQRQGIGIFEATPRRLSVLLTMLVLTPWITLLVTPFIRPFRWSRLVLTYLPPIVPICVMFDGIVSCLRTYSADELRALTEGLEDADYVWEIGEQQGGRGAILIPYLIGYPRVN